MSLAKERACGEGLSNRIAERFERKASFARSISENAYEAARIGAAAKRCAERGEQYAKHAIRTSVNAIRRLKSSRRTSMNWSISGFGSIKALVYLDWIDEEISETIEDTSARAISGWAPKTKQPYQPATVSKMPWLQSKSRPVRVVRTPKGRYVPSKVAEKRQKPSVAATEVYPSLPDLPRSEKRKANPIARLQAKQRAVQAQKSAAYKAIESLSPSLRASQSIKRLAQLEQPSTMTTSQTPLQRMYSAELQQDKLDRQVSPSEVAASRIQKGATKKNNRGLKPTWKHSPLMQALLTANEGVSDHSFAHTTDTPIDQKASGVATISGWGESKSSSAVEKAGSPSSRLAIRTMLDSVNANQRSILPVSTLDKLSGLLSSERSKDAYNLFAQSALKNSVNRSLLDSMRQASSSALPPVSTQSSQFKQQIPRNAHTLTAASNLAYELPTDLQSRLKLSWPLPTDLSDVQDQDSERYSFSDAQSRQGSGLENIEKRANLTGMERFAGQIKSSVLPYQSNVSAFQSTVSDSRRGQLKDLWLMTPNMVVTEPQDQIVDPDSMDSSQESAPRISAWTGAPVSNSPWLSHKKTNTTIKSLQGRLNQSTSSRRAGSVLPTTKSVPLQIGTLINQLPVQLKKEWSAVVKQVGSLSAEQHMRLKEHAAIARSLKQNNIGSLPGVNSSAKRLGGDNSLEYGSSRSVSSIQHAAMRDAVSRNSNPTRAVMTSILGSSALSDRSMISQALDAIQKKSNLRKGTAASGEKFWVDVFRAQFGRRQPSNRQSELSYRRPDSTVVLPGDSNAFPSSDDSYRKTVSAWDKSGDTAQSSRLAGLNESIDTAISGSESSNEFSSNSRTSVRDSSFVNALDRLDTQNNIGSSQLRNLNPSRLPAWAKGLHIPEAQYLSQMDAELANMDEDSLVGGRSGGSGAPVVNGWGSASRAERMLSGRKQLAYIHKSGQIIPISHAKRAGLPAPKPGARPQLPLGWTLEAVDSQVLNKAMPNWAQRSTERPLIKGTSDMVRALVDARSQEEVIRVIFDRADQSMPELSSIPTTATRFIEQIRKEAHAEQSLAASSSDISETMTDLTSRSRQKRRQNSNVVSGFSGLRSISTAKTQVQETEDRVSKLAKKLQDLVLLAEEKSRTEARQGIRMADNDEAAHNEGAAMSHDDAPNSFSSHDIDAFFQAVIDAYERERDFRKDRDGFEGNSNKNRTTWW